MKELTDLLGDLATIPFVIAPWIVGLMTLSQEWQTLLIGIVIPIYAWGVGIVELFNRFFGNG